jgi:hypothetical protein
MIILAVIMYSNAKPVIVSNAAAYTSLKVRQAMYDPIHRKSNITTVDAVEVGLPRSMYEFPT